MKEVFKKNITQIYAVLWEKPRVITSVIVIELLLSTSIIFVVSLGQITEQLTIKIDHIREDTHYTSGQWDMHAYNADPLLIGPYPLYFITTDGFVLDRRKPINGYLDTSDWKRLLSFNTPQTSTTITNQTRRLYAEPIYESNSQEMLGVVAVSYFNPSSEKSETIDKALSQTVQLLLSHIITTRGQINTQNVDEREVPYGISFVIIDKYNAILKKTTNVNNVNRIPNFIDPSYIKQVLLNNSDEFIKDAKTQQIFITKKAVFYDNRGVPKAVIVLGQTITPVIMLLGIYLLVKVSIGILFLCIIFGSAFLFHIKAKKHRETDVTLQRILFDESKGELLIGMHRIIVPYATNQFYLLQALFQKPNKRWETDELLTRFGEDDATKNGRKVYDTMVKINKKVAVIIPVKLITNQNKTYQLNASLIHGYSHI